MKYVAFILLLTFAARPSSAQVQPSIRSGQHSFTLQWIAFNDSKSGSVRITPAGNGKYSIQGEQRGKTGSDFVAIKGSFEARDRALYFDGIITSQIATINHGMTCERKGPQVFKASGARNYWRLQQMLNCDGETTDYIDIFF